MADASESPAGMSRRIYYGYWLVSAGFVAQFVAIGSQTYIFGAFLKPMTEDLDWTRSEYTLARTVGQFVMAAAGLYIGGHVDRHGGQRLMQVGALVLAGALLGCSTVRELWQWWLLNGVILTSGAVMTGNLVVNVTVSTGGVCHRTRRLTRAQGHADRSPTIGSCGLVTASAKETAFSLLCSA